MFVMNYRYSSVISMVVFIMRIINKIKNILSYLLYYVECYYYNSHDKRWKVIVLIMDFHKYRYGSSKVKKKYIIILNCL